MMEVILLKSIHLVNARQPHVAQGLKYGGAIFFLSLSASVCVCARTHARIEDHSFFFHLRVPAFDVLFPVPHFIYLFFPVPLFIYFLLFLGLHWSRRLLFIFPCLGLFPPLCGVVITLTLQPHV